MNNYLQELKLFSYVQVVGGNKHREGFIYKLTTLGEQKDINSKIETALQDTLKNVWAEYDKSSKQVSKTPLANTQSITE